MVRNNFQQNLKCLRQTEEDGKYSVKKVVINFVIDEGNARGKMGVYLGKNNRSIYFFRYIDILLLIYQTYGYILGDISIDRYINISLSICR